jgi:hypothetical protein
MNDIKVFCYCRKCGYYMEQGMLENGNTMCPSGHENGQAKAEYWLEPVTPEAEQVDAEAQRDYAWTSGEDELE